MSAPGPGPRPLSFLLTGGQLSGNLGAAAMVQVTVEGIRRVCPEAGICFLAKYFDEEQADAPRVLGARHGVRLVPARQLKTTFATLPWAALTAVFRKPGRSRGTAGVLGALEDCDVVVDIGGITFSRERGLGGMLINATWVLLPLFRGRPVVKLSQALGPFGGGWFRLVSRALLHRVAVIVSRGRLTTEELRRLGLDRGLHECADLAFLLEAAETERTRALPKPPGLLVGVSPSSVLAGKLGPERYVALMRDAIVHVLAADPGAEVWICAHAWRNKDTTSNNDEPVCRQVHEALPAALRGRARLVAGDYTPAEMRTVISRTDAFLACRFHAMVGALAAGVPVAVLGWSHKYREVLELFGLDTCIGSREASPEKLAALLDRVIAERGRLGGAIRKALPGVRASSERNFEVLGGFARKARGADGRQP